MDIFEKRKDTLKKAKKTYEIEAKYFKVHSGFVSTYVSICPFCDCKNEWSSTGMFVVSRECEDCGKEFLIDYPRCMGA